MRVKIHPGKACGRITAPASKSIAHRLLIAAALADGVSRISGISECEDVLATIDCLSALGVCCETDGDTVTVHGIDMRQATASSPLPCRESGSTLRFMLPIALLSGANATLTGSSRLMERPMSVYSELCREQGLRYLSDKDGITVAGPLRGGEISVPGNISSQFITGLLFAASCLEEDTRIRITTSLESASYIDLTVSAMASFGVLVSWETPEVLFVKGGQKYIPRDMAVEGDWSGTAFIDALKLFGGDVEIDGLNEASMQGDRAYRSIYPRLKEEFTTVGIRDCPDLGPILFTLAAAFHGSRFEGTSRLKIKESDRAAVMAEELSKFGARISLGEDTVVVHEVPLYSPTEVLCGHNDHRIVMSLAVLATRYGGIIEGAEAVAKSYPSFFADLSARGICLEITE